MRSLACITFNLMLSNLSLMGFHCNRVLVYLLEKVSATPPWCLLSYLPDQMMVSPEFSLCLPASVHLASVIPMMARL